MAKTAPQAVDVLEFQFKLRCRLKIFNEENKELFNKQPCNLIATASQFGLIFVGCSSPNLKVIKTQTIEELKNEKECDYTCRNICLPSIAKFLCVNSDNTKLCVVVEKDGCATGLIYDVPSFVKEATALEKEIRLSPTPGVYILEATWSPTAPNIFTVIKNNGSLGLYELKSTGIDINELPIAAKATCMCWSPKGKQIAIGSADGKITQYKPDLKAMKTIGAPPLEGSQAVAALQWISNYQFIAVYHVPNSEDPSSILVVDSPKTGEPTFTNYDDICYSYGSARCVQFYTILQPIWNVLLVASSNSMEVGVLGILNDQWTQWVMADAARAELPLSSDRQETLPVGFALDTAVTKPLQIGEMILPAAPILYLLSNYGMLCCFDVVNAKVGAASICNPPQPLLDTSGLKYFTLNSAKSISNQPSSQYTPPTVTHSIPVSFPQTTTIFNLLSKPETEPIKVSTPTSDTIFRKYVTPKKPQQPNISQPKTQIPVNSQISVQRPVNATVILQQTPTITSTSPPKPEKKINEKRNEGEEVDASFIRIIQQDCISLEAELQAVLHKGKSLRFDIGNEAELVKILNNITTLEGFLKDVTETCAGQSVEVHSLKQSVIQTWAWYEEARSRFTASQDPQMSVLLKSLPLDPASERHLADITHLLYYLESQLSQASRALDEQWDNFQDYCKKVYKLEMPTMETIFQAMVRQNVILQRQMYELKDISCRIKRNRGTTLTPPLLISMDDTVALERQLKDLRFETNSVIKKQFERVIKKENQFSSCKVDKLRQRLHQRVTHVSVSKPQLSNVLLQTPDRELQTPMSILGAQVSPVNKDKVSAVRNINFIQSTPKIANIKENPLLKEANKESSQTYVIQTGLPIVTSFISNKPLLTNTQTAASVANTGKSFLDSSGFAVSSQSAFLNVTGSNLFSNSKTSTVTSADKSGTFMNILSSGPVTTISSKLALSVTTTTINSPSTFAAKTVTSSLFNSGLSFSFTAPVSSVATVTCTPSTSIFAPKTVSTGNSLFQTVSSAKPTTSAFGNATTSVALRTTVSPSLNTFTSPVNLSTKTSTYSPFPLPSSTSTATASQKWTKNIVTTATSFMFSSGTVTTTSTSPFGNAPTGSLFETSSGSLFTDLSAKTITSTTASTTTSGSNVFKQTPPPSASVAQIPVPSSIFGNVVNKISETSGAVTTTTNVTMQSSIFSVAENKKAIESPEIVTTIPEQKIATIFKTSPSTVVKTTSLFTPSVPTTAVSPSAGGSIFGVPSATVKSTPQSPLFGNVSQPVVLATTMASSQGSIFSKPANAVTTTQSSIFGNPPLSPQLQGTTATPFGITSAPSIFSSTGGSMLSTATSKEETLFGQPTVFATSFSTTTTATSPTFGSSVFGAATSPVFGAKPTSTSPFGDTSTSATTISSVFGQPTISPPAFTSASVFGPTTSSVPAFGPTTSAPAFSPTTSPPAFGQTTSSPAFGPTASAPAFGPTTSSAPVFGPTTTSASVFGQPSSFGSSLFGTPTTTTANVFGSTTTSTANVFVKGNSIFGTPASSSPFTSSANSSNVFGGGGGATSPQTSFSFAAAAGNVASNNSSFGFPPSTTSNFGFGASNTPKDTNSFSFGTLNVGSPVTTSTSEFGSGFGQTPAQNPFSRTSGTEQKSVFGGGSLFATPASTASTSSIFGSNTGSSFGGSASTFGSTNAFGSQSAFGQRPAFGQTSFGSGGSIFGGGSSPASQQPGPFSGGSQSINQTGFGGANAFQKPTGGFGGSPVFGSSSPGFGTPPSFGGAPTFGSAPAFGGTKVFGAAPGQSTFGTPPPQQQPNSSFGNLANQNTLGFGNLAQQSQPPTTQSSPFSGNSSFSSWR